MISAKYPSQVNQCWVRPAHSGRSCGIRDSCSRGCPGCAYTAARTSSLCEWCSDRAIHTLASGAASHADIPHDPAAPRHHADPKNLAVPTDADTPRDSEHSTHPETRMVPRLPQMPPAGSGRRTGRPASARCRRAARHERSGGRWSACRVPPRGAARSAATASRRVISQACGPPPRRRRRPFRVGVIPPV
jgi:hypothetical protein